MVLAKEVEKAETALFKNHAYVPAVVEPSLHLYAVELSYWVRFLHCLQNINLRGSSWVRLVSAWACIDVPDVCLWVEVEESLGKTSGKEKHMLFRRTSIIAASLYFCTLRMILMAQ